MNQEFMLKASLIVLGYTHKFKVEVGEQVIIFEPDEERNYRAVIPYEDVRILIYPSIVAVTSGCMLFFA